jgi:protein TonB
MNKDLSLHSFRAVADPWRRLPWTLTAALMMWAVVLWSFAHFIEQPCSQNVELLPVDVQLVESAPYSPSQHAQPERHPATAPPKKQPLFKPEAPPAPAPQDNQHVDHVQVTGNPNANTTFPSLNVPAGGHDSSHKEDASAGESISARTDAGAISGGIKSGTNANPGADMGARAILRPMPQIPDDLREAAFNAVALAHFHISADGKVKVELIKPTPNPRLNRILLDSLRNWRFTPALKAGKPVESTEQIAIRIEVK